MPLSRDESRLDWDPTIAQSGAGKGITAMATETKEQRITMSGTMTMSERYSSAPLYLKD